MTDSGELRVIFGTGPVGISVMDELVLRGDATATAFAREASRGASVVYFALNPPYEKWPELFPPLHPSTRQ